MSTPHQVDVRSGDSLITRWTTYDLNLDITQPADSFSLGISPGIPEAHALAKPDNEISVTIDGITVLTGLIDSRARNVSPSSDSLLAIEGRDFVGRMLDESMPLDSIGAITTLELARRCAGDWFDYVEISNAKNRNLIRGRRAGRAKARTEPVFADRREAPKKVEPGQTRWAVLEEILQRSHLLAWAAADGSTLIVGLPNYNQESQFSFFVPRPGSERRLEGNVEQYTLTDDLSNAYASIKVVGASKGTGKAYGKSVTRNNGFARWVGLDGDGTVDAATHAAVTDLTFQNQKKLIVPKDDLDTAAEGDELAAREFAERRAGTRSITLTVTGHAQRRRNTEEPALYTPDCMCTFEDEEIGLAGQYLITAVRYYEQGGQFTDLTLVPKGTVLA